jgi:hypothetical protein
MIGISRLSSNLFIMTRSYWQHMKHGELAQLAERVLSMHEVAGSIPAFSTFYFYSFHYWELRCFSFCIVRSFSIFGFIAKANMSRDLSLSISLSASILRYVHKYIRELRAS